MATDENTRIRNGVVANYSKFVADVNVETRFLDFLIQENVVNIEFANHLRTRKDITKEDKCRQLLNEMFSNNNPQSFVKLREALTADYGWIVTMIDKTAATNANGDQQLMRKNRTLNEENEQLKTEVKSLKQSATTTTRDNNKPVDTERNRESQETGDSLMIRKLQHDLEGLRIKLKEAEYRLEQKDKEQHALQEKHTKELADQALRSDLQLDKAEKTIGQLRGEVAALKLQLGETSGEVAKWRASYDQETKRVGDLEAVLKKERTRFDAEKKKFNDELEVAKERANQSDRKLESAQCDHRQQLQNEVARSRAAEVQVKTLQGQLREKEDSEAQLKRSLNDKDLELKSSKQLGDKASTESESLRSQNAALKTQLEKSRENEERLETKLSQQNKEVEKLTRTADEQRRKETASLTRQLEEREQQLSESRETENKLKKTVAEKLTEIQRLAKQTNERSSSASASLDTKIKEISSLNEQLKAARAENELLKQKVSTGDSEWKKLVTDAEYREKRTSEQLQEKSQELEKTKKQIEHLTELNKQQDAKNRELEKTQRPSTVVNQKGARDRAPTPPSPLHRTESSTQVKVLYDYTSQDLDELSINEGEILTEVQPLDDGWATGTNKDGKKGMFPRNYCEEIPEQPYSPFYADVGVASAAVGATSDYPETYEMLHFSKSDEECYFSGNDTTSIHNKLYENIKPVMPDTNIEAATTTAEDDPTYLESSKYDDSQPATAPVTARTSKPFGFGVGAAKKQLSADNCAAAVAVGKRTVRNKTGELKQYTFKLDRKFSVADNKAAVVGLTELDGQLFVVREKSPNVFVHDIKDTTKPRAPIKLQPSGATRLHRLLPTTTVKPCDIVACKHNNCLYVSDRAIGSVVVVQQPTVTTRTSERCKSWLVDGLPYGLSVTSSHHNVLVCFPIDHRLNEYDHDGKLIHRINLPSAIAQPWRGIELEPRCWIVCHGGNNNSGSRRDSTLTAALHRVCLVDGAKKQVTMSHGNQSGNSSNQLNEPLSIVVDSKQRVLVADCKNNRVKVLGPIGGPELQQLQVIAPTTGEKLMESPCRLHLCENENIGRLFVGLQNGQVLCYEI